MVEIIGDCEAGTISIEHRPGFNNALTDLNINAYVLYATPGVLSENCNNCQDSCTPSDEYTALLNRVTSCWNSCCGNIPVGPVGQDFENGVVDTPFANTIADGSDGCPVDSDLQIVNATYGLIAGSEVNGSVVVNPNGSFTFTPDSGFTGTASFKAGMYCEGLLVGIADYTIQFA